MSVRLSIVLAQSSGGGSATSELEGSLVAELIGAAGMDLSIVGPLQRLADSKTDRLVLDGLSGDFALLAWSTPEEIAETCSQLGVGGARAPHTLDPNAEATAGSRRIYAISLVEQNTQSVMRALQRILESRRTSTVSLGLPVSANQSSAPPANLARPANPAPPPPHDSVADTPQSIQSDDEAGVAADEDSSLDSLVDDLNDSGI